MVLDGTEDAELFADTAAEPAAWEPDEDATASINYTSGTTARPKGVQITHRNAWLNAATFGWHTGVSDRDVYLHTLPMFHCNGWGMPYALTAMGARHVVLRKVDGEDILRRVDAHGVTLLCGAPAVVAAILDAAAARRERGEAVPGRGQVRMVVAGAPPPSKVIERVESELGWEFVQIYGLTATAPLPTINRRPGQYARLDPPEKWGETVKALVVLRAGDEADEAALIDFTRGRLAHFKCPTTVEVRDSLPRTATGKLQKFKLRQPYWEGHDRKVN